VGTVSPYAPKIPELLFFAFQLKFAAITPALIIGACAERIRFRSLLVFVVLWSTFIYSPIAYWMWNTDGGFGLRQCYLSSHHRLGGGCNLESGC
jgi:ammonia channel protein AmtB